MKRRYFDHASTTPLRREVLEVMTAYLAGGDFNPSSPYAEGRAARAALDGARAAVARTIGARPREIVFTGGGSEADNLAIFGTARARAAAGRHAVTAATEHHAVLHAFDVLRDEGFEITVLPVDENGLVAPERFAAALRPDTILASIMLANNETGALASVARLARLARERGVVFHTDAVQAAGRLALDVAELGVDLLSLSAHKFYGPKGTGALFVREGVTLAPLVVGGGQEAALRAGTENVAGALGFARAFELAELERPEEVSRLTRLQNSLESGLRRIDPGVRINAAGAPRLPGLTSAAFPDADAATLLVALDLEGVAASAGSACNAGSNEPSHVLAALGGPAWTLRGTVRFSLGRLSGEEEVVSLLQMLPKVLGRVRESGDFLGNNRYGPLQGRSEVCS